MNDAEIEALARRCGGRWSGDAWVFEDADLHPFARTLLAAERERCAKLVEAMDTTGHDGYIETTGDLCEALAARIRRA